MKTTFVLFILLSICYIKADAQETIETYYQSKTYIVTKSGNSFTYTNKAHIKTFEKQYKGKNKGIEPDKIYEETLKLKFQQTNSYIVSKLGYIFSMKIDTLDYYNQNLILSLRINKEGYVYAVSFIIPDNKNYSKLSSLISAKEISELEDLFINKYITFKTPNSFIESYTLNLKINFRKLNNEEKLFPDSFYM